VNAVGEFDHVPFAAVRVWPTATVPLVVGTAWLYGSAGRKARTWTIHGVPGVDTVALGVATVLAAKRPAESAAWARLAPELPELTVPPFRVPLPFGI